MRKDCSAAELGDMRSMDPTWSHAVLPVMKGSALGRFPSRRPATRSAKRVIHKPETAHCLRLLHQIRIDDRQQGVACRGSDGCRSRRNFAGS